MNSCCWGSAPVHAPTPAQHRHRHQQQQGWVSQAGLCAFPCAGCPTDSPFPPLDCLSSKAKPFLGKAGPFLEKGGALLGEKVWRPEQRFRSC
jgi:hypothetical protein